MSVQVDVVKMLYLLHCHLNTPSVSVQEENFYGLAAQEYLNLNTPSVSVQDVSVSVNTSTNIKFKYTKCVGSS